MEITSSVKRIEKWDIARGVLIFLVVLGHVADLYTDSSYKMRSIFLFIYSFHMPCFLFLDGMFSKKNINEKRYGRIFSYLVMYLFTKILICLVTGIVDHHFTFDLLNEYGIPWYGLVLFEFSLLTIFLKRFPKRWVLIGSIVLACFVGYDSNISDFLALSRVIVFFPFFFVGYLIDPNQLAKKLSSYWIKLCGLIVLLLFAILCVFKINDIYFLRPLVTGRNPYSVFSNYGMEHLVYYGGLLRLLYYIGASILCLAFITIIPTHIHRFSLFSGIGKRSLQIFILNYPALHILYYGLHLPKLISWLGVGNWILIPFSLALTLLLGLPIIEKPTRWIIYPKCRLK